MTLLPNPTGVLHQAIDQIKAAVDERTQAVQEAMKSLDEAVRLLESYEGALAALGGTPKRPRGRPALRPPIPRSTLGLTLKGQAIYDALPTDGAVVDLKHLSEATGLDLRVVAVSASHLSRHHGHLVRRMGTSTYRRRHAGIEAEFEVSNG